MASRTTFDALPVGYRLDDYRIVEVLGKGGFGITYKAMDERLDRHVAVKEYLPRDYALRAEAATVVPRGDAEKEVFEWGLKRFVDEARTLARFRHPNIVAVMRFLEANGTAYLVMEYEEGEDLEHWLAGRPTITEALLLDRILLPVLDGLAKVHAKQLLHRDIKPQNIFIRSDGSPVLLDFGASRPHGAQGATNLTSIVSAGYSPFEQYGGGNARQGPWTDLYALAGTMYRVIAGTPPVDAIARMQGQTLTPATEVGAGRFSEPLLSAIDRALALEAKDRPQSVAELRALLVPDSASAPTRPLVDGATMVRPRRGAGVAAKPRRRPLVATVASLALLAAAGGVAGWYYLVGPGASVPLERIEPEPATAATGAGTDETSTRDADRRPSEEPGTGETSPSVGPNTEVAIAEEVPVTEAAVDSSVEGEVVPAVPVPPPALSPEDGILEGLDVPNEIQDWRTQQIAGALLDYAVVRREFFDCQREGCARSATLFEMVQKAQRAEWTRGDFFLSTSIRNAKELPNNIDCPLRLDLTEVFRGPDAQREQTRTYCTALTDTDKGIPGFTREVDRAGPVKPTA